MSEWQPIETAPKGKTVIVWGGGGMRFLLQRPNGQWQSMMGHPKEKPKYWMPLPKAPE